MVPSTIASQLIGFRQRLAWSPDSSICGCLNLALHVQGDVLGSVFLIDFINVKNLIF